MDIDFQYIINMYQGNLCNLVMRKERGLITEKEYEAEVRMNRLWFGDMAYWLRKYEIQRRHSRGYGTVPSYGRLDSCS